VTRVPPRRFNSLEEFGISTISPTKSFVINPEGVIYEKDLGPTAANTAQLMEAFNPDRTWTTVPENQARKNGRRICPLITLIKTRIKKFLCAIIRVIRGQKLSAYEAGCRGFFSMFV